MSLFFCEETQKDIQNETKENFELYIRYLRTCKSEQCVWNGIFDIEMNVHRDTFL